jgi:hypothetical protein
VKLTAAAIRDLKLPPGVTKLTAANIRALKLPPGVTDKVYFDEDLPGFGLRVRASGVHTWMIQYAIARRTRRVVLGLEPATYGPDLPPSGIRSRCSRPR